mmetsp:Transcript_37338/g.93796  ORF Transcript_37338/g.93796 Transcript_37338/m.93796 type:complete len:229 (+) Transcript_37338:72-758(+)
MWASSLLRFPQMTRHRLDLTIGVVCAAMAAMPHGVVGSSLYLAKLCRNFACHQAEKPMMDYDEDMGQCVCKEHPCWNDNGQMHHCLDPQYPYLGFHYTEAGELTCTCSSIPHYGSLHIAQDKCSGHRCEQPDHPILDWDEDKEECVCRSHPCWNDKGERHECKQPQYPILRYREEEDDQDQVRSVCECFMKLEKEGEKTSRQAPHYSEEAPPEDEFMSPDYYYDDDEF